MLTCSHSHLCLAHKTTPAMSDKWNYHQNRGPHSDPSYNEWSYHGFQQHHRPPDYFSQANFAVPPPYPSRTFLFSHALLVLT
ncbi:hypothetical protein Y032_0070g449 [Ancylostoma ceylanicum]|uniref:Uncharacterized protein n=1 Tax=Ancylostoma ceylanicum TaxID=53326 RepID=A0A016TWP3_9BILA|nr:hypothetical protein Y032_0070g449 [Ancylostoma ceylanicum]